MGKLIRRLLLVVFPIQLALLILKVGDWVAAPWSFIMAPTSTGACLIGLWLILLVWDVWVWKRDSERRGS